ncbi:MAG: hypothetical protein ACKVHU_03445 [Acidimicrobiales bacterium]|jgi:predicted flap endonuclease-1-like 5' DNA nuclease
MIWLIGEILVFLILAVAAGLIIGYRLGRLRNRTVSPPIPDDAENNLVAATDEATADGQVSAQTAEQIDVQTSDSESGSAPTQADGVDQTGAQTLIAERDAQIEQLQAELAPYRTDDLKLIHGVGPVFERSLNAMGYTTYDQIAAWSREDVREVATEIDLFPDRIIRDEWIEQAAALAKRKANPSPAPSIRFEPPAAGETTD